jgi:TolA-binding protein
MRTFFRMLAALALCLGAGVCVSAQTKAKPAAKTFALKSYCHPAYSFCFKYPATWTMLGEVLEGNGVVVAPTQAAPREDWDAVTVSLVVPAPAAGEAPVTIEEAIAQAASTVRRSGQAFETLQRQQRTVDGQPAEMLKLQYTEQGSGKAWVEELVFIEGPESEIYSIALKCHPAALAAMEPRFAHIVDSWKQPGSEIPAATSPAAPKTPAKTTPPKSSAPPKP